MLLNLRILRRRDSLLLAGGSYQGWCEVFVSMKLLLLPWEEKVPAGEEKAFPLPTEAVKALSGGGKERVLTLSFALKQDTPWAAAGHAGRRSGNASTVRRSPSAPSCS